MLISDEKSKSLGEKITSVVLIENVISLSNGITTFRSPVTGKEVHITSDADEALDFILQNDEEIEMTPEEDRKLLRKIDMYVLPLVCLLYALQFMDKQTISYASVLGLRADLNMHGQMYAWAGSIFYYGYLVYEFIGAHTLQRFPVMNMVSIYIVIWGVILCLLSVPNYAGFMVLRFLLGAMELSITPAFVIITAQWYKKEEVFIRTAIWISCNGIGTMLGAGAIAYNVYRDQESLSITPWKLIYIITGVITIALGLVVRLHLPNKPTDAWFLSDREKRMVVERIRGNQQGFGNKHFKKEQFIEALTDYRTWLFFFIAIAADIPNGGLTNFGSILLLEKLGYDTKKTLLMNMPTGAVEFVGVITFASGYRLYPVRLFWAVLVEGLMVMATCFLAFADNKKLEYAGFALTGMTAIYFVIILSMIASNVVGHTKKVTVNAIFLIGYCTGNLIGPQTFKTNQAPNYTSATVAMVVCMSLTFVALIVLWIDYSWDNKRRDARMEDPVVVEFARIPNHEFADLTDKQNPLFRYSI